MSKIKVLLIEDNRLLREGIAAALDGHGDFEVIAESEDGDTVKKMKKAGKSPDVVLLDLGLAKINSLKLMGLLRTELPDTRIIAMDIFPEQDDIIEFVEAGGSGFILKSASLQDYVETIQTVAEGEKVLPTVLTASLFTHIVESALSDGTGIPDGSVKLTNREKEIVELISDGLSNKQIAQRLHIATHTAKSHVHNILEKLTLSSRLQIAAFARKQDSE
jgi:DNA-binding NarL/FixJ family response regulator